MLIVGNAPLDEEVAALADGADHVHVIRFNKARAFGGASGSRTDELWLINHGGQMAEWLEGDALTALPALAVATSVVLPVPMLPGHLSHREAARFERERGEPVAPDRVNHADEARRRLLERGFAVQRVGVGEYRAVQRALRALSDGGGERYPSTGFIAIFRTLARARPNERIELCGFTFDGWGGHSWQAERRWVLDREREGRLSLRGTSSSKIASSVL